MTENEDNGIIYQKFWQIFRAAFLYQDGVQVIYGENEYGKSTLQAFIRAMLFEWSGEEEKLRQRMISVSTSRGKIRITMPE